MTPAAPTPGRAGDPYSPSARHEYGIAKRTKSAAPTNHITGADSAAILHTSSNRATDDDCHERVHPPDEVGRAERDDEDQECQQACGPRCPTHAPLDDRNIAASPKYKRILGPAPRSRHRAAPRLSATMRSIRETPSGTHTAETNSRRSIGRRERRASIHRDDRGLGRCVACDLATACQTEMPRFLDTSRSMRRRLRSAVR
jgi:hypothetical protein